MGKAPVDLPDPLEQPSSPPGAGADDLLSQLAGDEIDRLLAEAERAPGGPEMRRDAAAEPEEDELEADEETVVAQSAEKPDLLDESPAAVAMPAAEAVMDEIVDTAADVSNQLDELIAQLDDKPAEQTKTIAAEESNVSAAALPPTAEVAPEAIEKGVSADELDQVLSQAATSAVAEASAESVVEDAVATTAASQAAPVSDVPPAPAHDPAPAAVAEVQLSAPQVDPPVSEKASVPAEIKAPAPAAKPETPAAPGQPISATAAASVVEAETSAAERSLLDTALAGTPEGADEAHADLSDIDNLPPAVPIYLKPLVWFNAPFAAMSESKRESLGKIAVVTTINAIAVLLYVLIFRSH